MPPDSRVAFASVFPSRKNLKTLDRSRGFENETAFKRVINGISTGKYDQAAESVPEKFGISRSSKSHKFIRASAKVLHIRECPAL